MPAMTRNKDRVLAYLATHPEGQDDDQLGAALQIDRHQINEICRRLAETGATLRGKSQTGGKLLNQLALQPGTVAQAVQSAASVQPSTTPATTATTVTLCVTGPLVWHTDSHAMQLFAYTGSAHLTEDAVKAAVKQIFEEDGWHTEVHFGHIQGIDIEAMHGDARFVLEAKGEGNSDQERGNYFDGALGELLRRMNAPDARYGLALPAHRRFTGLVGRLPLWIRQRLSLWFFFVRPAADAEGLEVGVFPPDARRHQLHDA